MRLALLNSAASSTSNFANSLPNRQGRLWVPLSVSFTSCSKRKLPRLRTKVRSRHPVVSRSVVLSCRSRHKPIASTNRRHLQVQRRMFRMPALIQHRHFCLLARKNRYQNVGVPLVLTKVSTQPALSLMNCLHVVPPQTLVFRAFLVSDRPGHAGVARRDENHPNPRRNPCK